MFDAPIPAFKKKKNVTTTENASLVLFSNPTLINVTLRKCESFFVVAWLFVVVVVYNLSRTEKVGKRKKKKKNSLTASEIAEIQAERNKSNKEKRYSIASTIPCSEMLYTHSTSGSEGLSKILHTRWSPRPLRSDRRVVDA